MSDLNVTLEEKKERAIIVGVDLGTSDDFAESMEELEALAEACNMEVVCVVTQKMPAIHHSLYIGTGKVVEVREYVHNLDANVVIFGDTLTPSQLRNLQQELDIAVMDRTNLILEIFSKRARTREARLQVEVANLQYILPRLIGMHEALSRQGGGSGLANKGAGEKKLELDRRKIEHRLAQLRRELEEVSKDRQTQRKQRANSGIPRVALVGYTNAGKSTMMNLLSKSDVFAENKLFATLDTTVRKVIIDNLPFLMTDTVGFIRKLPHHLIESFKSTLDEVREADLLVHILDISHPNFEEHYEVVNKTLLDVCKEKKPTILVFNKIDAFTYTPKEEDDLSPMKRENYSLDDLKKTWMANMGADCVFVSAREKDNIDELKALLYERVKEIHVKRFPYNDFLFQKYDVEE